MQDRWTELATSLRKPNTLVINLFGGPGVGKSTVAALTFGLLKDKNVNAELVTEYAKDMVWQERGNVLEDQVYIFAKQAHRVRHLLGKVDVVVTDGPILLSKVYATEPEIVALAQRTHDSWNTRNYFIERNNDAHPYNPVGRTQKTVQGASVVDKKVRDMLVESTKWFSVGSNSPYGCAQVIVDDILGGGLT